MEPETLRAEMPGLAETAYLNTGAAGPSPRRVVEASERALERFEYESPAEGMYDEAFATFDEARAAAADHVGADHDDVALTESTTDGVGRLVAAMDWQPGDVVVHTDLEHPAGTFPCERVRRLDGIEVRVAETEGGRIDREAYAEAVADARLVVFSSLTWTHGTRLPVAELVEVAHDAGARVLVDAVQIPGQAALDVSEWDADFVVAAGHKWLLGPWGAGFLHVHPDAVEDLQPDRIGYRSVEEKDQYGHVLNPDARRLEVGTVSPAAYAGLREAIETMDAVGYDTIEDRIRALTERLTDGIPDDRLYSPREFESGLVSFRIDDPDAFVDRADAAGVKIRSLPQPEGAVRASVHAVNTHADVETLLELV